MKNYLIVDVATGRMRSSIDATGEKDALRRFALDHNLTSQKGWELEKFGKTWQLNRYDGSYGCCMSIVSTLA